MNKKSISLPFLFIACLSLIFMAAILFTQYQSASIVNQLKGGNAQAVRTIRVYHLVDDIINEIFIVEGQSAKFIASRDSIAFNHLQDTLGQLNNDVGFITKLSGESDSNKILIARFNSLISRLTEPVKNLTATSGPVERALVAATFASENSKIISDSIYTTALAIQLKFEKDLEATIIKNELLSGKVLSLSMAIGIISIAAIAILATIIIRRLRKYNQLIEKLNKANEDLQVAKQQTERAANIKEQFLSNMSHEIRTPVNSIIGFTNLLQKTELNGSQAQFTGLINAASENLLNIINDILDISKIEAGMLHFDKNPFDIRDLLYSLEMLFYHPLSQKNLDFESTVDDDVPEILIGDKGRFTQILTNLFSNAIKFTDAGGIVVCLSVIEKNENNCRLKFSIKDSGIGINADILETIFERFEQGEKPATKSYGGTGLGLSIVRNLVTKQGGSVTVKSEEGAGAEFIVEMPFSISREPILNKTKTELPEKGFSNSEKNKLFNIHVLAAEDNKMNQMLLSFIFQEWGVNYDFANTGVQAIELLKQKNYDVILMDIQMPLMDGYTSAKAIRDELKISTPIIAMSAKVMPGEKEKCRSIGMNDYLSKPLNETILYDVIVKNLDKKITSANENDNNIFIDKFHLNKVYKGRQDFIRRIVQQFLEQYPTELSDIMQAVNTKDYNTTIAKSHLMKTTVALIKKDSPLLDHLDAIENSENTATGWEVIHHKTNLLIECREHVLEEAKMHLSQLV